MTAGSLLSETIVPLRTSDTGEEALEIMNEFQVRHLPIVNQTTLLGLVAEEDILDMDVTEAVGSYPLSTAFPRAHSNYHIYEVMRLFSEYRLTVVPVIDAKDNYLGLITLEELLRSFSDSSSFRDPGSIVVLEMGRHDYSLAEIARIVESEGVIILSAFVGLNPDSNRITVTLKFNSQTLGAILATFERFNYQITASYNEREMAESLQDRYDSLLNYLNV
ncbi:MAG: CBS domain-containing protein [Saprospiraceae bacterium]